ncbi:MAG TPA: DUF4142 domain-containing protein [Bacteroidia bacterium]|jgi:putative membrane protein|nr:DUF4142 domain-containing protein [Bacteroidia bacterium]
MKNTTYKTVLLSATLITFIIAVIVSCNNMQTPGAIAKTDSVSKGKDAQFIVKVAGINLEEIKLGQLAQQKGLTAAIKELGKMMEEDHTKAQSDLTALALKESITIPIALDSNALNDYKKLSDLSGKDFDKQYCDMMESGHKDAIALFEKEVTDASDSAIRQMAAETLPTLKKHLEHVTMCQQKSGGM